MDLLSCLKDGLSHCLWILTHPTPFLLQNPTLKTHLVLTLDFPLLQLPLSNMEDDVETLISVS